ncbi:MAG: anti-sigma factor [Bryobacteraceae bacterium]|jgi:anti-sigma factor RsiW
MTCAPVKSLLEPYLDEELDAVQRAQVAEHLAACGSCAEMHARLLELRTAIRAHAPYYRAPASLPQRIRFSLRQANRPAAGPWRRIAIAAAILLSASAAWNVALFRWHTSHADLIAQNVLSSHVRSLMGAHLLDVPSSDRHTVKPWFNGKLDFSPNVRDLAAQGFPLIGGRMDYVDDRPVAVLVYQRRQHVVNLFTWPAAASAGKEFSRNGYQAAGWNTGGMAYWAISDIGAAELRQFESLYKQ